MDGSNTGTSEEGCDGLPSHGKVDGDGRAFGDAERFEDVCYGADFTHKLGIGDQCTSVGFVGFVDDGGLVKFELD